MRFALPATRVGWGAVGSAATFVAMCFINGLVLMNAPIPIRAGAVVASALRAAGFDNVVELEGSYEGYEKSQERTVKA